MSQDEATRRDYHLLVAAQRMEPWMIAQKLATMPRARHSPCVHTLRS